MNDYTSAQLMAMQRDAIRRVNEMQRIARERVLGSQSTAQGQEGQEREQNHPEVSQQQEREKRQTAEHTEMRRTHSSEAGPKTHSLPVEIPRRGLTHSSEGNLNSGVPNALGGIFDRIGLESDQLILGAMILVLINEGADNLLILALAYILL